ncbi:MAG: holo-ACP synthase [Desulfotomaculaceae bacterium]|nr:holo-ACP synthase [Desulfotomaculaceae bacterium]
MPYRYTHGDSIIGVGTDIVEIDRIKLAVERSGNRFLERIYTSEEITYCEARRDRFACYAARFAAKEAILKALGSGLAGCRWVEVEVSRIQGRPPGVLLHGAAAALADERGIGSFHITLSHSREFAVAFAVAAGRGV